MSMSSYSILVGKTYRTAEGEVRQVTAFEDGEVVYLRSARRTVRELPPARSASRWRDSLPTRKPKSTKAPARPATLTLGTLVEEPTEVDASVEVSRRCDRTDPRNRSER